MTRTHIERDIIKTIEAVCESIRKLRSSSRKSTKAHVQKGVVVGVANFPGSKQLMTIYKPVGQHVRLGVLRLLSYLVENRVKESPDTNNKLLREPAQLFLIAMGIDAPNKVWPPEQHGRNKSIRQQNISDKVLVR